MMRPLASSPMLLFEGFCGFRRAVCRPA